VFLVLHLSAPDPPAGGGDSARQLRITACCKQLLF